MANRYAKVANQRRKRKMRVRNKVAGTNERPRLSVFRSATHVYAQVIDDVAGKTLVSIHTFAKGKADRAGVEACSELGKKLAGKCKDKKIEAVVFDKGRFNYHGRVKAFADGAREGGLNF